MGFRGEIDEIQLLEAVQRDLVQKKGLGVLGFTELEGLIASAAAVPTSKAAGWHRQHATCKASSRKHPGLCCDSSGCECRPLKVN